VSDEARRLRTEEDVEWFYRTRRRGGECAACGRALTVDEPVYIERFEDARRRGAGPHVKGPVGAECISDELLLSAATREAERCAGCGRPVYYRLEDTRRRRVLCSQACRNHAASRRQAGGLTR
jgi:hypothetical protein